MASTLDSIPSTLAKSGFAAVWRSVVGGHRPQLVSKYGGKEAMLLVRREDALDLLESHPIVPVISVDEGEFIASVPEMAIIGAGETLEVALDDLVVELRAYAIDYFNRFEFYRQTDRRAHAPALLRFAVTPDDQQRKLLLADAQRVADTEREAVRAQGLETA